MRRVLRIGRTVLVVLAVTLVLDFAITTTVLPFFVTRDRDAAEAGNRRAYIVASPHHHDLEPNVETLRVWGPIIYRWKTDKNGLRTGACAPGDAEKAWPAIFVIGDSFVEALGSNYEQSFVGLMACDAARQKKAVWNLGVSSYSPIIYWRKVLATANKLDVKPTEIYVFLDLSDIDDEANVYREAEDGTVKFKSMPEPTSAFDLVQWLVSHFTTARLAYDLNVSASFDWRRSLGRARARWTIDKSLMDAWGKVGLDLAAGNLDRLVGLCRDWRCKLTLVVYPWPDNVMGHDKDSVQVRYWRDWAARRGVRFVDGFAPFFDEPDEAALHKYFIEGDVHFTEAGNRLIYETVRQAVGGDW
jgi:hypothetical protein